MTKISLTRKQLYDQIWEKSVKSFTDTYDISDNDFREACKSRNIPLPKTGYWSKVKHNKPVFKTPLPEDKTTYSELVLWTKDDPGNPNRKTPKNKKEKLTQLTNKSDKSDTLSSLKKLPTTMDVYVKNTKQYYEVEVKKDWSERSNFQEKHKILETSVSTKSLHRALLFWENLIRTLNARGHQLIVENGTYALVRGEKVKLRLREKNTQSYVQGTWGRERVLTPNGFFVFSVGESWRSREYTDTQFVKIEEKISDIVSKIESVADEWIAWHIESERQRREQERKRKEAEDLRNRQENELKKFVSLFNLSKQHEKAEEIRKYVKLVNENAIKTDSLTPDKEEWIKWALHKADWFDPFVEAHDELLNEVNKQTLELPEKKRYW